MPPPVRAKFEGRSFIRLRNIGTFRCGALIDSMTLTFDLLTLKSVWESHVTWGTPVQSFVFLGLLIFELEQMYATSDRQTDGQTDDGRRSPLNAPAPSTGRGHNNGAVVCCIAPHCDQLRHLVNESCNLLPEAVETMS